MAAANEQNTHVIKDAKAGAFVRPASRFLDSVSAAADAKYPAEAGRYRLYASRACPWAHRTLVTRALKGLQDAIPVTITGWKLGGLDDHVLGKGSANYHGWDFDPTVGVEPHGFAFLDELYELSEPGYRASFGSDRPKYSVPVLFDEKTQKIVSNESADIILMLNSEFNAFAANVDLDLHPASLQEEIARVNTVVYPGINDGVYRCGFARSQEAYDDAIAPHAQAMATIEERLGTAKWLCGDTLTMADVRLFPTLIRYDIVYTGHFKTARRVSDMPNMSRFLRAMLEIPGVAATVNLEEIVRHYYWSQTSVNPTKVTPRGPQLPPAVGGLVRNSWGLDLSATPPAKEVAGAFQRRPGRFQDRVVADPAATHAAEAGRYRLYISRACPWAHRTLIVRALKGLEDAIAVTVLSWNLPNLPPAGATQEDNDRYRGWEFDNAASPEPHGFEFLDQLYEHAAPGFRASYSGSKPLYSVPVLFDEKTQTIVSNESAAIVEMLNSEFNSVAKTPELDLYPKELEAEMEGINSWIYSGINNGVYRCGFASGQEAYDAAALEHWRAMERLEALLSSRTYLAGDRLTMADVRLFPTMIRYDCVYLYHFKTALKPIADMPGILRHTRMMLALPGMREIMSLEDIIRHYHNCHLGVNPTGIVPRGPRVVRGLEGLVENTWGLSSESPEGRNAAL